MQAAELVAPPAACPPLVEQRSPTLDVHPDHGGTPCAWTADADLDRLRLTVAGVRPSLLILERSHNRQ